MVDTQKHVEGVQQKVAGNTNATKTGAKGKEKGKIPIFVWIIGAVLGLMIVAMIILALTGGKKSEEENLVGEQEVASTSNANGQAPVVYDQTERDVTGTLGGVNIDYSKDLVYFYDPTTGVQMVETPTGPLVAQSAEGQAYIRDYEAKRSEWLAANQQATQANQNTQANVEQQTVLQSQQIAELQQTNANLTSELTQLKELSKAQTEAIDAMSTTIRKLQPVFDDVNRNNSSNQKGVVLTGKNKTVDALAIQNGRAWIEVNGEVKSFTVGDSIGNKKIRYIDGSANRVIVQ